MYRKEAPIKWAKIWFIRKQNKGAAMFIIIWLDLSLENGEWHLKMHGLFL